MIKMIELYRNGFWKGNPANTKRQNNVISTSMRRHLFVKL